MITNYTRFVNCSSLNQIFNETTFQEGGAITAFQSEVLFYGNCSLVQNYAKNGGALYATESKVYVYGKIDIANNTAMETGGGIYVYQSELNCRSDSILNILGNNAIERGGGIHAISSSIKVEFRGKHVARYANRPLVSNYGGSVLYFTENQAKRGGGVLLEVNAKLYILKKETVDFVPGTYTITFTGNLPEYGGAMFVADNTNSGTCASVSYKMHSTSTECFVQALNLNDKRNFYLDICFKDNYAKYSGSLLFGGLLDRCTLSPFAEVYADSIPNESDIYPIQYKEIGFLCGNISGVSFFTLHKSSKIHVVSSDPVRICFCKEDKPDCSYQPSTIRVKKGERFTLNLVAVDHVNNTVSNTTIRSSLSSKFGGLGEDQLNQTHQIAVLSLILKLFPLTQSKS